MLKKVFSLFLVFGLFLSPVLSNSVLASTIEKDYRVLLENGTKDIVVKNNVTKEDLEMSIDKKSVLQAIQKADESDEDWSITELVYYPSFNSLYLKCVEYLSIPYCEGWNYKVNDVSSWDGVEQKILSGGEKVQFYFQPWGDPDIQLSFEMDTYLNSRRRIEEKIVVIEQVKNEIDLDKLVNFIETNIKKDNQYLGDMYVDWAIIGLASKDKERALKFLDFYKNKEKNEFLTENIRKSMALLSLGQNPYNFENKNHIETIVKSFDGEQFGEKNLVNDDIFSLIVLQNVGFNYSDTEIQKSIQFLLKSQNENGSIGNSADMTSAYIQALKKFENVNEEIRYSLDKAKKYLENSQGQNGSWNDSLFSTAWVLQTLSLYESNLKEKYENAFQFIANLQDVDGGLFTQNETIENRIWASSYMVPAILGKPWKDIMITHEKELPKKSVFTSETITKEEPQGEVLGEETFKFTQFMKFGTKGGEVSELQKRLTQEGFFTGPITGYFGILTKNAVKKYQEANPPLKVDGIVGPKTRAVLNGEN